MQPLAGFGGGQAQAELAFRTIKSSEDLDRELAAAQAAGEPLLFDFYADWCVACKEREAYTFTDPGGQAALADVVLLKADVTANEEIDQALVQGLGISGPPATLFFNGSPEERRGLRLVGFEKAAPFAERVRRAAGAQGGAQWHEVGHENRDGGAGRRRPGRRRKHRDERPRSAAGHRGREEIGRENG